MLQPYEEPVMETEDEATTWIALSDLMTGLMAIFLTLSIAILVNQHAQRDEIVQDVQMALKNSGLEIETDPRTGDMNIAADFAFESGKAVLKPEGKAILDQLMPVFAKTVFAELSGEQQEQITRLIVEGHTDSVGGYASNMKLSTERANAVLTYIDTEMPDFPHKAELLAKMTAVGRGENDASPSENPADRRVLLRFDFKQIDWTKQSPSRQ
ncbi:OmpA/MotB family protein [Alysiella crassa]|uniref:Outer membrane protein P5 n=1 Tax=Alysiella crassa TaxID=153491 RepID=A0A376BTC1_9NEIS|nr:OmpA family protein [Alysiella crassa]UOP07978.1 OmpA family protein [Alysiella crassa]SSY80043.1 Outer membrane protein P5 precursor [Alysiella crassa]